MTVVVGSLHHVHTYCIRMSLIKMISGQLLAISHLCGLSHHYDSFLILAQISLLVLWLCLIAGECKILVLNLESHTLPYFHYITLLPCFYIAVWHWQFIFSILLLSSVSISLCFIFPSSYSPRDFLLL